MSLAFAMLHVSALIALRGILAHIIANRETSVMTRIAVPLTLLVTALVCSLAAAPAQAQTRTYTVVAAPSLPGLPRVTGPGSTACGSLQSPCATLQAAFAVTAENGVIDVLDPGEYGPLTITHGVTIQGHGFASVAAPSGTAITITAGTSDDITLRGVLLDGLGTGTDGIAFNTGGSLTIQDSVIRRFAGTASNNAVITFAPSGSSKLFVSNTLVADNAGYAIIVLPSGSGTVEGAFDHIRVENNAIVGLFVYGSGSSGTINFALSDSVIADNGNDAVFCQSASAATTCMVRNTALVNNAAAGLHAEVADATIWVSGSTITENSVAANNNGATLLSFGNNSVIGNTNGNGPLTTTPLE
jgi:hypothetical protein